MTLILTFCLLANARSCIDHRIPMTGGPMACLVAGEQQGAAEAWERPRYRLKGWRCEVGDRGREA